MRLLLEGTLVGGLVLIQHLQMLMMLDHGGLWRGQEGGIVPEWLVQKAGCGGIDEEGWMLVMGLGRDKPAGFERGRRGLHHALRLLLHPLGWEGS